ncbi:MAG: divalent-cation tolerance protein CutA [Saprospiraceae bacterium]
MELLILYVPCSSEDEAQKIVEALLAEKLIACGNIISSDSIYSWNGGISNDKEWIAIMKSLPEMLQKVEMKIKILHSYEVSAIIHWQASCNAEYLEWVQGQLC